jgi:hypothetical protein
MEQLERGEADKAASVKARIRKLRKAMNKSPEGIDCGAPNIGCL